MDPTQQLFSMMHEFKLLILFGCFFTIKPHAQMVKSHLEVFDIQQNKRILIYMDATHFEAPNWSVDGKFLLINSEGKLYKIDLNKKEKKFFDTGEADKLNNDHGISPSGKYIALSHSDQPGVSFGVHDWKTSKVFIFSPVSGSLKAITQKGSFWHGWSPDERSVVYTGLRNQNFDIYSLEIDGGPERRLTFHEGLDDGPEYSPDGKYIFYNSMESGSMEIWRMKKDGSSKTQLTKDSYSNWFPHPSPDGKWLVYIAYLEDQGSQHPPMEKVALRLMNLRDNSIRTLCDFIGGQGTINVPSWAPDSKRFAFVSYSYQEKP